MAPIRTLERIRRELEFADVAEARRYLKQQARRGFLPAAPTVTASSHSTTTAATSRR